MIVVACDCSGGSAQAKAIEVYRSIAFYRGFVTNGKKFLTATRDYPPDIHDVCQYSQWTGNALDNNSACDPPLCDTSDDPSTVTITGNTLTCPATNGTETVTLSNEYTRTQFAADTSSLLAAGSFSSITADCGTLLLSYQNDGSVTSTPTDDCSPSAFYYTDSATSPTWIHQRRIRFTPTGPYYVRLAAAVTDAEPTRTLVRCTPGAAVTIEPPTVPGYITVANPC